MVEQALASLEERVFWAAVHDAFSKGQTPESSEEREIWDTTVGKGPVVIVSVDQCNHGRSPLTVQTESAVHV